ncbi:MAG TPA: hypothetical protein VGH98_24370 [Gemmatimonadaceae bacterium]|jgi:hypothetical protein
MHNQVVAQAARMSARLSIVFLAVVSACEVPTKLPIWDQTWVIPGDSTRVSVSELLPKSGEITVSTSGGQPVFALSVAAPAAISRSLGQVCGACTAANGMTVPKPAFSISDSTAVALPTDLVAATIVSGGFTYTITNNFSFDPIRPSAAGAPYGYFVIRVMNGATLVALDSVDGSTLGIGKNGATLQRPLPLNVGGGSLSITSATPVEVYLTLNSPQGDPVTINTSQSFSVAIQPAPIALSQAQVQMSNQTINAAQTTVDLSSVSDQSIVNRVQGGALHLNIDSPFGVQGTLTATFSVPGGAQIVKSIPLTTAATQTLDVPLTAAELRSLLGHTADLTVSGSVNSPSGSVTLTPTQVLRVTSTFQITLSTTES